MYILHHNKNSSFSHFGLWFTLLSVKAFYYIHLNTVEEARKKVNGEQGHNDESQYLKERRTKKDHCVIFDNPEKYRRMNINQENDVWIFYSEPRRRFLNHFRC